MCSTKLRGETEAVISKTFDPRGTFSLMLSTLLKWSSSKGISQESLKVWKNIKQFEIQQF